MKFFQIFDKENAITNINIKTRFFLYIISIVLLWSFISSSLSSTLNKQGNLIEPVFMSCSTGLGQTDNFFTPSCFKFGTTIPKKASLWDPEFSPDSKYAIWMNGPPRKIKRGREMIFAAPLDPETGDIIGEAVQQIKGTKPVYYSLVGNGPEWGFSLRAGSEGYFSAFSQDGETTEIHRFTLDSRTNTWFASVVPNSSGMSFRRASQNPVNFVPRLYLQIINPRSLGPAVWREDIDHPIDQIVDDKGGRGDWIDGTNKLFISSISGDRGSENRKDLPIIYDSETNSQDQLFKYPEEIGHLRAWQAPELYGDLIAGIVVRRSDYSIIEIYRRQDDGEWKLLNSIESIDSNFPHIFKFEPFVFKGESYIAMIMYPRLWGTEGVRGHQPAKIGLVGNLLSNGNQRFKRIVSLDESDSKASVKMDLEILFTNNGKDVRVIYADYPASNGAMTKCHELLPKWKIKDPEFNQEEMLAVWRVSPKLNQDGSIREDGKIYITPIDMETGDFSLIGQSEISNANPVPQKSVINGPEWANSQRGWEIFYSCYSLDKKTVRLCKLDRFQNTWRVSALPSSKHKGMRNPSKNALDPVPNLFYQYYRGRIAKGSSLKKLHFGWREDTDNPVDVELSRDIGQGKWMPDGRRIVHIKSVLNPLDGKNIKQLAIYDRLTNSDELMLNDGRERRDPFAWNAPELNGQPAIVSIVQNRQTDGWDVEVYRQANQGEWILWSLIPSIHPDFRVNFSPEAFVFKNKSYISIVSYRGNDLKNWRSQPSIVWIASVDPNLEEAQKVHRIVSQEQDVSGISRKTDPESLLIQEGNAARIYYVDFGLSGEKPRLMNCDTGLAIPD
jgi:hypothetical protein